MGLLETLENVAAYTRDTISNAITLNNSLGGVPTGPIVTTLAQLNDLRAAVQSIYDVITSPEPLSRCSIINLGLAISSITGIAANVIKSYANLVSEFNPVLYLELRGYSVAIAVASALVNELLTTAQAYTCNKPDEPIGRNSVSAQPDLPGAPVPRPFDPLVLDLDGNGIEFSTLGQSNAYYDFTGTGFATKTGWIKPGEGFLVEDKGNGKIALFGNATQDGFAALRRFDSNQDGQVSALDNNFASLAIWRDVNGDGTLDPGERLSLAEAGVAEINLQTTESSAIIGDTSELPELRMAA